MKRGTPDHWKMDELARLMKIPSRLARTWANGCMERLWHYTSRQYPRGNIGAAPDWAIADACGLAKSDAPALIEALLHSKWIEKHSEYRLIVHDWHEHADDSTKKTLKNRGLEFCFPESSSMPGESFRPPLPILSSPKPLPSKEPGSPSPKNGSGTAHGTRLSISELPDEWKAFAMTDCGWDEFRAAKTFEVFKDYWKEKPGAAGRKVNWLGTWRNWCRREKDQPMLLNFNGATGAVKETRAQRRAREMDEAAVG